jgi:glycosyltransferase involved in cell wall biosynthesis
MAELVDDGVTGQRFAAGDPRALAEAIRCAVSDPVKLLTMRQAARREYETNYLPDDNYATLMAIYQAAIARRAKFNPSNVADAGPIALVVADR